MPGTRKHTGKIIQVVQAHTHGDHVWVPSCTVPGVHSCRPLHTLCMYAGLHCAPYMADDIAICCQVARMQVLTAAVNVHDRWSVSQLKLYQQVMPTRGYERAANATLNA